MELAPIAGIHGLGPSRGPKIEQEVAPPFALDATGRMEDDAYNGHGEAEERGLEDEEPESISESPARADDKAEASPLPDQQNITVNFFV